MATFYTNQLPARTVHGWTIHGWTVPTNDTKEYHWFGGTDYLGMGHNEAFLSYLSDGLKKYGTHFGSSRNNTLQLEVYREAELLFSNFTKSPDALLTSSGMWAGQLVVNYCAELAASEPAEFHYAPNTHPALWSKETIIDTTSSWADWAQNTIQLINSDSSDKTHFIFSDSVRSPLPELHDFSCLDQIYANRKVILVIDDSHGLGVLGSNGRGINSLLSTTLFTSECIVVSSLNKAMGIPGGVILASNPILEQIRKTAWFSGSSPTSPAYIAAARDLLKDGIYEKAHDRLISNITYFNSQLSTYQTLSSAPNYPVFCSTDESLHSYLIDKGILTTCFSYPSPEDKPLVRMVISTCHEKEDLFFLAGAINEFYKESRLGY